MLKRRTSNKRRVLLITAESAESRFVRHRRLIRFPQLTMPLIAAYTPEHWDVIHVDEIVQKIDFNIDVDLVGITANTPAAPHAYSISDRFRSRGIPTVIGGPHATLMPEEVKEHADAVVIGEGETVWPAIIQDVEQGTLKPFYKCSHLPDLKNMPHPRWDLIKGRVYGKGITIATRGCPFACDYCTIPAMYQRRMRYRPIEEIVEEVKVMPGKALIFWDDNIGANREYAKSLFRAIAPLKRWWTSQATHDVAFDDEFMELAAKSGCKALFLGLETISQESLNGSNKRHNKVEEYKEVLRRFHYYGIAVQAGTVFGFDGDDKSIFRRTVEFYKEIGLDSATISVLVPFPNTPLFRRLDAEGRILTRDWSKYDGKKHVVFQPAQMSPEELLMGTEWAARQFYSASSIFERMWKSRTGLWWNIIRNVGYNLALRNFGNIGYNPEDPPTHHAGSQVVRTS
ncbi:MAG: B12-binding domain-containing radical SAM protein [Alicyclobacillus macrosporangiidus]|uniref:B12-binding domain-containing radical SAM protein n=1 Tax=Alicyclobacillus macrosporangiidus TaxID=392015 RepID=UPI0026EBB325|nr:radical SAM protein [Alicyclobacillus macrosporangiidus]MCL6600953.1 B12-binding domain-containing radical SAM protein [Alicyclobacillus macrosporangiidus]